MDLEDSSTKATNCSEEKTHLINEIVETLEDIVSGMQSLNSNLEQLILVSNDTARLAEVWSHFFQNTSKDLS